MQTEDYSRTVTTYLFWFLLRVLKYKQQRKLTNRSRGSFNPEILCWKNILLQMNTHKQEKHQHRKVIHFPDGLKFTSFFISFHYKKNSNFLNKWFDNLCYMWEQSVCDNISCVEPAVVFYLFWYRPCTFATERPWNSGLSISESDGLRLEEHQVTTQLSPLGERPS